MWQIRFKLNSNSQIHTQQHLLGRGDKGESKAAKLWPLEVDILARESHACAEIVSTLEGHRKGGERPPEGKASLKGWSKTGMKEASWGIGREAALLGSKGRPAWCRGRGRVEGQPPCVGDGRESTKQSLRPLDKSEPQAHRQALCLQEKGRADKDSGKSWGAWRQLRELL